MEDVKTNRSDELAALDKEQFTPKNFGERLEKTFFPTQPVGLVTIFFTEIWERFSYYGMRALLILYMTKSMLYSDDAAYGVYGAYNALVYATPIIGGVLADRIIGHRISIMLGALLMMCGHFILAIPGDTVFFIALGFLIIGNGFFKPNMAPMINYLYDKNDPRREGGFVIFYMGVNIGSFTGMLLCGWVGETIGWHYGFSLAGFGMLLGLLLFRRNQYLFGDRGLPTNETDAKQPVFAGLNKIHLVWIGAFIAPLFVYILIRRNEIMGPLLNVIGLAALAYIIYIMVQCTKIERHRLITATTLTFFSVLFWAFFEQGGGSLTLFADRNVNKDIFGLFEMKASMTNAFNAFFIIILAPFFSAMWLKLAQRGKDPNYTTKFAIAFPLQGFGFYIMALGIFFANADSQIPMIFLVAGYFFITTGELSISPVGLGMITKLSPAKIVTFMMGVWFLSLSFAHHIAAQIGKLTSQPTTGEGLDPAASLASYSNLFEMVFWISLGTGLLLFLFSKQLTKWEHDEVE